MTITERPLPTSRRSYETSPTRWCTVRRAYHPTFPVTPTAETECAATSGARAISLPPAYTRTSPTCWPRRPAGREPSSRRPARRAAGRPAPFARRGAAGISCHRRAAVAGLGEPVDPVADHLDGVVLREPPPEQAAKIGVPLRLARRPEQRGRDPDAVTLDGSDLRPPGRVRVPGLRADERKGPEQPVGRGQDRPPAIVAVDRVDHVRMNGLRRAAVRSVVTSRALDT